VSTGRWKFRENHLTRALKAAKKAGYCVDKAVINADGDIELVFWSWGNFQQRQRQYAQSMG
jgi:hypothetical protein